MVSKVTDNTFRNVYRDDFRDSDNFHRVLFNSGRSLQARELTQLQTIIQREIQRFGDWIFQDGAAVNPRSGGATLDNEFRFIKLSTSSSNFGGYTTEDIVGAYFQGSVSSSVIKVIQAVPGVGADPDTIYVKYVKNLDPDYTVAEPSETLTALDGSGRTVTVAASNATGAGVRASVSGGTFYAQGHFVYAPPQTIILSKYTSEEVSANLGYIVEEEIVTALDDENLYDNQGVNPNRSAPGADRYRIRLNLATESQVASGDVFVPFVQIVKSTPGVAKDGTQDTNKLDQLLSKRTFEESGNYLVEPFNIQVIDGDSDGALYLEVDSFTAYVNGNRVTGGTRTTNEPPLWIPKPTSSTPSTDYATAKLSQPFSIGNFVLLDSVGGLNNFEGDLLDTIDINNGLAFDGSKIGSARIAQIQKYDDQYLAFLSGTKLDAGQSFRDAGSFGTSASNYANVTSIGAADIFSSGALNYFAPLFKDRVQGVSEVSFEVQRAFFQSSNGAGEVVITGNTDESFQDVGQWIILNRDTNSETIVSEGNFALVEGNGSTQAQATITGLAASTSYAVYAYVRKKAPTPFKTKTLTSSTVNSALTQDSSGTYLDLGVVDIYALDSVRADSANGQPISTFFNLDNGQRPNVYEPGRLVVKTNNIPFTSTVYANFRHFTHSGTGNYYSISSYTLDSDLTYADVPNYRANDGRVIELRDVLDFRSDVDRSGAITNEIELPRNLSTIDYDMTSYNGRVDVLYVDENNVLAFRRGTESLDPKTPPINTSKEMPLYTLRYGANTLSVDDVNTTPFIHKRFTMRDISDLEKRVTSLEEATSLSLLEVKTKDLVLTNDDGLVRAKSGFFVDNFKDFPAAVGGTTSPEFDKDNMTQSIDFNKSTVHPKLITENVQLVYDSDLSTNTVLVGDLVFPKYEVPSTPAVSQEVISNFKNVNPFIISTKVGQVILSPSSDTWVDTRRIPDRVTSRNNTINRTVPPDGSNNWWNFGWNGTSFPNGVNPAALGEGSTLNAQSINQGSSTTQDVDGASLGRSRWVWTRDQWGRRGRAEQSFELQSVTTTTTSTGVDITDRVTGIDTFRNVIRDRVVQTIFLPFMRQRMIYFKATGLRPNTKHYPFFDRVDVSQWCKEELTFRRNGDRVPQDDEIPNRDPFPLTLEHPRGSEELISDENGEIIGSFLLPNTGLLSQESGVSWENAFSTAVRNNSSRTGLNKVKDPVLYDAVGWRFRVGEKLFQLLDVPSSNENEALSFARTSYTAAGNVQVRRFDVSLTRQVTVQRQLTDWSRSEQETDLTTAWVNTGRFRFGDPIAQTFAVTQDEHPFGMFVDSIDVFVKSAPAATDETQPPLILQIRAVRDGTPVTEFSSDQSASKTAAEVRAAISGQTETSASVLAHPVNFQFEEPVFLQPGEQYAIVMLTDTDQYEVYISTVFDFILGSNSERVTKQPTLGSFFESQNASTWSPLQNSDLAYRIYACKFSQDASVARFVNRPLNRAYADGDVQIITDSGSNTVFFQTSGHGLLVGDYPQITGLDSSGKYGGILGASLMDPSVTVTTSDVTGFQITVDSAATDSDAITPNTFAYTRNFYFDKAQVNMDAIVVPTRTNIDASISMITGQSYANDPSVTFNDTRYNRTPVVGTTPIQLNESIIFTEPKMIANDSDEQVELGGNKSLAVDIEMSTRAGNFLPSVGVYTSDAAPYIDTQRASVTLINNLIDNQDSVASAVNLVNTPTRFIPETSPLSGTSPSKHITKPVITAEPSIALKINFDAYRPEGSNFDVYYRICDAEENIYDFDWILQEPAGGGYGEETPIVPSENSAIYSEFAYFAGDETGITVADDLPLFTQYQVKVVMRSKNTAAAPILRNLRVIALAT